MQRVRKYCTNINQCVWEDCTNIMQNYAKCENIVNIMQMWKYVFKVHKIPNSMQAKLWKLCKYNAKAKRVKNKCTNIRQCVWEDCTNIMQNSMQSVKILCKYYAKVKICT